VIPVLFGYFLLLPPGLAAEFAVDGVDGGVGDAGAPDGLVCGFPPRVAPGGVCVFEGCEDGGPAGGLV
jgi:hypothetical protein